MLLYGAFAILGIVPNLLLLSFNPYSCGHKTGTFKCGHVNEPKVGSQSLFLWIRTCTFLECSCIVYNASILVLVDVKLGTSVTVENASIVSQSLFLWI